MRQCLSCNQPCSSFSAFCDNCRASLLARDRALPEEKLEKVMVGRGGNLESESGNWEAGDGVANLTGFPRPEGPQVGAQQARSASLPPQMAEEACEAWSQKTSDLYALNASGTLVDAGRAEEGSAEELETSRLAVCQRLWQRMPAGMRRAFLIFCVVGLVALLTDGLLLALSLSRHHLSEVGITPTPQVGIAQQQQVSSPEIGSPVAVRIDQTPILDAQNGTLALSASRLAFSAAQGQGSLVSQSVSLMGLSQGGTWRIEPGSSVPAWLRLSAWQGNVNAGTTAVLAVNVHPPDLAPGIYSANLLVKAFDAQGKALKNSPASLFVSLNVHAPCTLSVNPEKLSFASVLGSVPASQSLTLIASSGCVFPVTWHVSSDAPWLSFARSSGTASASNSTITVQATTTGKLIGSYTGHITLRGNDSTGAPSTLTPSSISATLTVIA